MSMTDSDKTSTKKYKEKDIPELYLLRDADKATYLDPAEAEADNTSTEKKRDEIPVLYPDDTSGGRSWRTDEHKGLDERLAERNENWNKEPLGGSPMDYMDAPISKAYTFLSVFPNNPEIRLGLQRAMARKAMNGDKRANAIVNMSPKARDELTTVWGYNFDNDVPMTINEEFVSGLKNWNDKKWKSAFRGANPTSPRGWALFNATTGTPEALTMGKAGYHQGKPIDEMTPFHETDHEYDDLAGWLSYPHVGKTSLGRDKSIPQSTFDMDNVRAKIDELPPVKAIENFFRNNKIAIKDYPKDRNTYKEIMMTALEDDINKGLMTKAEAEDVCNLLFGAYVAQKRPKNAGIFQTEGGGRLPANVAGWEKNYAKAQEEHGIDSDMLEGNAVLTQMFTNKNVGRWLEKNGIKQDDLFKAHIPYEDSEEARWARDLMASEFYEPIPVENPKIRAGGSEWDKMAQAEHNYLLNHPEHSPEWMEAIAQGKVGDRYGTYDEPNLEDLLEQWRVKNGYKQKPEVKTPDRTILSGATFNSNDATIRDRWDWLGRDNRMIVIRTGMDPNVVNAFPMADRNRLIEELSSLSFNQLQQLFHKPKEEQIKYIKNWVLD